MCLLRLVSITSISAFDYEARFISCRFPVILVVFCSVHVRRFLASSARRHRRMQPLSSTGCLVWGFRFPSSLQRWREVNRLFKSFGFWNIMRRFGRTLRTRLQYRRKKQVWKQAASTILLGLFLDPDDGGNRFLWNAVESIESQPTFRRNMTHPSLVSKNNPEETRNLLGLFHY
jgi:hypothetical protein